MTLTASRPPVARRAETPSSTHLFVVGQTVRLRGGFTGASRSAETYRITATLPPGNNSPQYRIRSDNEPHERVSTQDSLEPVAASDAGSTLSERTFG